jgi:hypothetical protein
LWFALGRSLWYGGVPVGRPRLRLCSCSLVGSFGCDGGLQMFLSLCVRMFFITVILDYMLLRLTSLVKCVCSRCLCLRGTMVARLGSHLERRLCPRVDVWPPGSGGCFAVAVLWRPGRRPNPTGGSRLGLEVWSSGGCLATVWLTDALSSWYQGDPVDVQSDRGSCLEVWRFHLSVF